ncbi:MAG: DVUA0089 family protein, partial [Planctomycetota bacterium]|nr:DVUA0089 family protein [Planctomycetota bacterium]
MDHVRQPARSRRAYLAFFRAALSRMSTARSLDRPPMFEPLEPRALLSAAFDVVGLTALRADPVYAAIDGQVGSQRIGVAVIDTGVYGSHPALQGNFVAWFDAVKDGSNPYQPGSTIASASKDPVGHGTHVSGTVASTDPAYGVATKAGLIGVRGLADKGESNPGWNPVLAGLKWVLFNRERYNIRVVNMSLGDGQNLNVRPPEKDWSVAIGALEAAGVTVVSASGNSFAETMTLGASVPAVFSTLSVANTWEDNGAGDSLPLQTGGVPWNWRAVDGRPKADDLAGSSQRSTLPNQIAAPGTTILSLWNGDGGKMSKIDSGTSMASPLVAGSVALLQDAAKTFGDRYLSPIEVRDILLSTADNIVDAANPNTLRVRKDATSLNQAVDLVETGLTFKRINVYNAVKRVRDLVTQGSTPNPNVDPSQRSADTNNTLASAQRVPALNGTNQFTAQGRIGTDGQVQVGAKDVDVVRLDLTTAANLKIVLEPRAGGQNFNPMLRLFNASGQELARQDDSGGNFYPTLQTTPLAAGAYYLGISANDKPNYNI